MAHVVQALRELVIAPHTIAQRPVTIAEYVEFLNEALIICQCFLFPAARGLDLRHELTLFLLGVGEQVTSRLAHFLISCLGNFSSPSVLGQGTLQAG